jgi:hypothetical protein
VTEAKTACGAGRGLPKLSLQRLDLGDDFSPSTWATERAMIRLIHKANATASDAAASIFHQGA